MILVKKNLPLFADKHRRAREIAVGILAILSGNRERLNVITKQIGDWVDLNNFERRVRVYVQREIGY